MTNLPTQRQFLMTTGLLAVVELLSWFAYQGPWWERGLTTGIVVALMGVAWKRPNWLAYASIAELIIGGKGYLFFLMVGSTKVSIRMILFALIMVVAVPRIVKNWRSLRTTILSVPFLLFVSWLALSVMIALIRRTSMSAIYYDANAFMYLALLPAWWVIIRHDASWRQWVVALLLGGATMLGFKSWLMVALFGHDVFFVRQVYLWIRNTGIGEITYVNNGVYRVFFQSQLYCVIALILSSIIWLREKTPRWWLVPMFMAGLGTYISLSRSFWLGLGASIFLTAAWLTVHRRWHVLFRLSIFLPIGLFAWAMMIWAISWPQFSLTGNATAVSSRLHGAGSADAATARRNQIRPLLVASGHHPVWGSGFGQTATYFSTDPTSRGWRTTSAFELGYFDLWLKLGLVGIGLYGFWVLKLWRTIAKTYWGWPLITAGIAVVIIHTTSPYLNHPLGIGWLMLTALFAYDPV